jgi:GTP-sensing pleiotropic transcriptional regulator CodY
LRDIPQEQKSIPANAIKFPITPTKYEEMLVDNAEMGAYLQTDSQFYILSQTVYRKFSKRITTYLAMAITTEAIDGLPQNRIYEESDTLDAILQAIDDGGLG